MSPDLTSLRLVALQAMNLAEAHVRTHQPRLVIPKGDRDMATDVDLAIERMTREFLAETTPTIGFLRGGCGVRRCVRRLITFSVAADQDGHARKPMCDGVCAASLTAAAAPQLLAGHRARERHPRCTSGSQSLTSSGHTADEP